MKRSRRSPGKIATAQHRRVSADFRDQIGSVIVLAVGDSSIGVPIGVGHPVRMKQVDGSIRMADTIVVRLPNESLAAIAVGFDCASVAASMIEMAKQKMVEHGCAQAIFTHAAEGWRVAGWIALDDAQENSAGAEFDN